MRHRGDNDKWDKRHNSRVEVSAEQALADLVNHFGARAYGQSEGGESFYLGNELYIHHTRASSEQVTRYLYRYFTRKRLPKGYRCHLESKSPLWTQVSIRPTYQRAHKKHNR